ncbi:MAG: type I-U CRISPR-associated protein Csb2, partial [Myxococcota bacterium]
MNVFALRFRFPGGLYHATPYGRHVNEGEVEWPPGPWRLARALVATGYTKLGWTAIPAEARPALYAIGTELPSWHLPPATLGHSRHYMPEFKAGDTTKVLDAWVRVPRDAWAWATYRATLAPPDREVLRPLLAHLGYLGRAESWVEAELTDEPPADPGLVTLTPDGDGDPMEVLRLADPAEYPAWRAARVEEALTSLLGELRSRDVSKGKAPRAALSKADRDKVEGGWPAEPLDVTLWRTSELRSAGFQTPPGTRRATYLRPPGAIATGTSARPRRRSAVRPLFALLSVTPATEGAAALLRLAEAVWTGEKLHDLLVSRTDGRAPEVVAHRDDHRHLTVVPLALGEWRSYASEVRDKLPFRGVDHILLWCPDGLSEETVAALTGPVELWGKNIPKQRLALLGCATSVGQLPQVPHLATSKVWVSATPFVPARFLKRGGRNALVGQIESELRWRGIEAGVTVEVE